VDLGTLTGQELERQISGGGGRTQLAHQFLENAVSTGVAAFAQTLQDLLGWRAVTSRKA
jgi:hypothetical protein